jgi:tetratricopeptide (TPR) repeat protein
VVASKRDVAQLEEITKLRAYGRAHGWPIPQIVQAIVDQFGISRLKAHRLARGWSRPEAIERLLATYDDDGLQRPKLAPQRLCEWEHDPQVRPGEDYLDRLCRLYETRPDLLGYGHDYTPTAERAVDAAGEGPQAAYAGAPAAPLALTPGERNGAGPDAQPAGEEANTNRNQVLRALGATGLAVLLDRAGRAAVRLSAKLGSSNLGPVTLEQLDLRVAGFMQDFQYTPWDRLFDAVLAQYEEVEVLLDGHQPLRQRRQLYHIAGQLSALLGATAFNLGDYTNAQAHLLTAWQLANEVGDHDLIAVVRVNQSTTALWAGNFQGALDFAQDGQRYASGPRYAQLATRGEARAYARMSQRPDALNALRRADQAMPSQPVTDDPGGGWSVFSPGASQLYTGISLLWLGDPKQAEVHAREAIACYETQPPPLQSPANHAQAQITLATCVAGQGQPEEGIRLAAQALGVDQGHVEANLQQAREFLTTLSPQHRNLPAAREFTERLRILHPRPRNHTP